MTPVRATLNCSFIALAVAACAGEATVAAPLELRAEACRVLAAGARGDASGSRDSITVIPDSGLPLPASMTPTGGLVLADSSVYVFDLALGRILRVNTYGRITARMGRSGRGPGEFSSHSGLWTEGRSHFLVAHGDTLIAYDGVALHRFSKDGAALSSRPLPLAARPFLETPNRIAIDDGVVYVESLRSMVREAGKMTVLPTRQFHVWRIVGDSAVSIASLDLPQLPRMGSGGFFGSPAEARPSWDLRAGCLAMIDGSSPRIVLVDVRSGDRDTLAVPLPERFVDAATLNAELPIELRPAEEPPPPALLKRVDGLRLGPDGSVWLEPALRTADARGGIEVWRFHLGTRAFSTESMDGFPYAFTLDGAAHRITSDDEGMTRVLPLARLQ